MSGGRARVCVITPHGSCGSRFIRPVVSVAPLALFLAVRVLVVQRTEGKEHRVAEYRFSRSFPCTALYSLLASRPCISILLLLLHIRCLCLCLDGGFDGLFWSVFGKGLADDERKHEGGFATHFHRL